MFSFGRTLSSLDPSQVSNLATASANAKAFMAEVVHLLKAAAPEERAAQVA